MGGEFFHMVEFHIRAESGNLQDTSEASLISEAVKYLNTALCISPALNLSLSYILSCVVTGSVYLNMHF